MAYDAAGNMTTIPQLPLPGYTAGRFTARYDAWNRLRFICRDDGDEEGAGRWDAGDTTIAEYRYDGLGRRITKLVLDRVDGKWDRTDYFYNDRWQVLEERLARNLTAAEKDTTVGSPHVQYVWDIRYLDSPICRFRDANDDWDADGDGEKDPGSDGLEETLYYLTDANHNVTAVVEPNGNVVERYLYDAYGRVHVLNGAADADGAVLGEWTLDPDNVSDWSNEILYAGYRHDPETLLYHVRHRYLHATLGRWISSDPEGYVDGMSLYEYCRTGPMGKVDPYGLEDFPASLVPRPSKGSDYYTEEYIRQLRRTYPVLTRTQGVRIARAIYRDRRSPGASRRVRRYDIPPKVVSKVARRRNSYKWLAVDIRYDRADHCAVVTLQLTVLTQDLLLRKYVGQDRQWRLKYEKRLIALKAALQGLELGIQGAENSFLQSRKITKSLRQTEGHLRIDAASVAKRGFWWAVLDAVSAGVGAPPTMDKAIFEDPKQWILNAIGKELVPGLGPALTLSETYAKSAELRSAADATDGLAKGEEAAMTRALEFLRQAKLAHRKIENSIYAIEWLLDKYGREDFLELAWSGEQRLLGHPARMKTVRMGIGREEYTRLRGLLSLFGPEALTGALARSGVLPAVTPQDRTGLPPTGHVCPLTHR